MIGEAHPRNILMLCWDYDGYNRPQTAALVKRPRYFAESLFRDGHHVTVIFSHHAAVDDTKTNDAGGSLRLLSVNEVRQHAGAWPLVSKFRTLYELVRFGDFSGRWHQQVFECIKANHITFEVLLACFTPRGPLYSACKLKKHFRFHSVFDLQDPYHEGLMNNMARLVLKRCFGRILRSADVVICVNKEWCAEIERDFAVPARYLPHVIEEDVHLPMTARAGSRQKAVFFYSGSLDEQFQDPSFFFGCLHQLQRSGIFEEVEFRYAGGEFKKGYFASHLPEGVTFSYLGWLSREELFREIAAADVLCVFPITNPAYKTCIPSKFYEYCRFGKPIAVVGEDTGAFADEMGSAFAESHVLRRVEDFLQQARTLQAGAPSFFVPTAAFMHPYRLETVYSQLKSLILC